MLPRATDDVDPQPRPHRLRLAFPIFIQLSVVQQTHHRISGRRGEEIRLKQLSSQRLRRRHLAQQLWHEFANARARHRKVHHLHRVLRSIRITHGEVTPIAVVPHLEFGAHAKLLSRALERLRAARQRRHAVKVRARVRRLLSQFFVVRRRTTFYVESTRRAARAVSSSRARAGGARAREKVPIRETTRAERHRRAKHRAERKVVATCAVKAVDARKRALGSAESVASRGAVWVVVELSTRSLLQI